MPDTLILQSNSVLSLTVQSTGNDAKADSSATYSGFDSVTSLNSATVSPAVPISKFAYNEAAMTAGALTLDLTALPHEDGTTVDGDGLKLQKFRLQNPATNSNNITIVVGASNPYDFAGDANSSVTLAPGAEWRYDGNETLEDIDSTHCEIDISGTGTEVIRYTAIMG